MLLVIPTHLYRFEWPSFISLPDSPIGLAYIASSVRAAGHEVASVNLNNAPDYPNAPTMVRERLGAAIDATKPDVICTGGISAQFHCVRDILRVCREKAPDTPTVVGGGLMTFDPHFVYQHLRPSFGIVGEGEMVLPRLLNALETGDHNYHAIPNLVFKNGSLAARSTELFHNDRLEDLPYPDHSIFGDFNRWAFATRLVVHFPEEQPRYMNLVAGRSCPFRCTFCIHERHPAPYRARAIPDVIAELEHMMDRYPFNVLNILDELFTARKERVAEFSQAIIDKGWKFKWMFQTHSNAQLDLETLKLAKRAGCYLFAYGLETASPTVIKSMRKHLHLDRFAAGCEAAKSAGIGFCTNLIFGDPAETPKTVRESLQFFQRHLTDSNVWMSSIQPYPGSAIFAEALNRQIIPSKAYYYERIDERRYNLTQMASWQWLAWLAVISWIGGKAFWLRVTKPVREETLHTPYGAIVRFVVRCPHCHAEVPYRHFIPGQFEKRALSLTQNPITRALVALGETRAMVFAVRLAARVMGLRYASWRSLLDVLPPDADPADIRAGCRECNRQFKIRV